MTFEELDDWEGLNFDLIVSLSPEAHHKALDLTRTLAADVEYWPTPDPTAAEGSREQRLDAYRAGAGPVDRADQGPFRRRHGAVTNEAWRQRISRRASAAMATDIKRPLSEAFAQQ